MWRSFQTKFKCEVSMCYENCEAMSYTAFILSQPCELSQYLNVSVNTNQTQTYGNTNVVPDTT